MKSLSRGLETYENLFKRFYAELRLTTNLKVLTLSLKDI